MCEEYLHFLQLSSFLNTFRVNSRNAVSTLLREPKPRLLHTGFCLSGAGKAWWKDRVAWWANALLKSADDMMFRGIIHGEENENLSFGLLCIIEMYLEVQGITTWNFSVAAGKGSARPSRPAVSCRDGRVMTVMTMALESSPGEAWAEDFWHGHKHGEPLDEGKTPAMCLV